MKGTHPAASAILKGEIMNTELNSILFKIIDGAFSCMFIKDTLFEKKAKHIPVTPYDFKPVLRFAVCSDIHISGEEIDNGADNLGSMLDDMNELSDSGYNGIDALMVAGDMTNRGLDSQYKKFVSVLEKHKKEETKLLICIGNHEFIEYRDFNASIGHDKYKKYISSELDTHSVLNGYHFVGISYSKDARTYNGKERWIEREISKSETATPHKPVFVFQHPNPTATVYGSIIWGDKTIKKILKKHRSVIDFSGHSHCVPSDPRSVYQGRFTAFGTGSLEGLLGNPGYTMSDTQSLFESAACLVVEADASGNVRVRCYDVTAHRFFKEGERYLPNVTEKGSFVYRWSNMKKLDTKPEFKSDDVSFERNEDGTASIVFDGARGFYKAESYCVTVKTSSGRTVFDKVVLSEYSRADELKVKVNAGNLESGTYRVIITPRSPFAKLGKKTDKILYL